MADQKNEIDPLKLTWDDLRDRARNEKDLSADQRQDAVVAFNTLERIFGNALLDKNHSRFFFFFDRSAWRAEWAIWFAKFISSLEQHPDYSRLIHELKNPWFYGERMTILRVVEMLLAVGFMFRLDSPISINNVLRKPDILVQLDRLHPGFYIEVTTLGQSEKELEACRAFDELWGIRSMMFPVERCSGILERTPTSVELQEIKQQINATKWKAENETGFETLEVPGLIKFACAKESNDQRLELWATTNGMKVSQLAMAGTDVDEYIRIARKLREKMKQVPADRANVIVLYSHMFAKPPRDLATFAAYVNPLVSGKRVTPYSASAWRGKNVGDEKTHWYRTTPVCAHQCRASDRTFGSI